MPNFLEAPEILPLPSLQAYSSISFLFLSCSLYYAFQITSEPDWKSNSSYAYSDLSLMDNDTLLNSTALNETLSRDNFISQFLSQQNVTALFSELCENQTFLRIFDVTYIMVHEPLCVWTLINMGYCLLILFGKVIQKLVFGDLRVPEHQLLRDKFWNFLLYKFIFVFSVINVQYMDELLLWCAWFSVLGFMFLLVYLCKERFSYLTFSPSVSNWDHFRLISLQVFILISTIPLFIIGIIVGIHTSFSIGAFLISECLLLFLRTLYCFALYSVHLWDISRESIWEKRTFINYYIELIFDLLIFFIDFSHHLHMLFWGNIILSVSSLVILIQLRSIFYDINNRIKKHKNYLHVLSLMEENFPIASSEELAQNTDDCAICWDHMNSARKLPCGHFFHTTCLRSWLEQDTSCPTCRHSLRMGEESVEPNGSEPEPPTDATGRGGLFTNTNIHFTNHFFQFDGSRYARWLPSLSVEVTRPSMQNININGYWYSNELSLDFGQQQIENMGQQVLELFPQISLSAILEDLRVTRSVEHTIENILDWDVTRLRGSLSSNETETASSSSSSVASGGDEASIGQPSSSRSSQSDAGPSFKSPVPSSSLSSPCMASESPPDSEPLEEIDTTDLDKRFLEFSADERKDLLTRRKELMLKRAKKKFLDKNSIIQ